MITRKQLRLYRSTGGDTDMLFRVCSQAEIELLTANDAWGRIQELIHMARRLEYEQLAPETAAELNVHIQRHTADDATRRLLQKLGRTYPHIGQPWPVEAARLVFDALAFVTVGIPWLLLQKLRKR